jgi:hypothetical protein
VVSAQNTLKAYGIAGQHSRTMIKAALVAGTKVPMVDDQ